PPGPGSRAWYNYGLWALADRASLRAHHDFIAVDPRGTGDSGVIDCPDLQDGVRSEADLQAAVAACGKQLGDAADRYGPGNVAMAGEAIRRALGSARIDISANGYGTAPEQAYAARYPSHVHALVFDGGTPVTDAAHVWVWGLGIPAGMLRAGVALCRRHPACARVAPDPATTIRWLVQRVRTR